MSEAISIQFFSEINTMLSWTNCHGVVVYHIYNSHVLKLIEMICCFKNSYPNNPSIRVRRVMFNCFISLLKDSGEERI